LDEKGEGFTNILQRIRRGLLVLAFAPLYWLEKKELERKLEERLKRSEQKQKRWLDAE
jgi:hypothetical protein